MTEKATAVAPSNIAFVKYWGARDLEAAVPMNRSVSMTLRHCVSWCTVEARPGPGDDEVFVPGAEDGEPTPAPDDFAEPVLRHLARLRRRAGRRVAFRVATRNSFPSAVGLASSASGFAALTLATVRVLGMDPDPDELSRLARSSGSGSAARSVLGGYVEWPSSRAEAEGMEAPARQIAGADHWDLRDVIAIVSTAPKEVSSREGHRRATTSPHYERRLECVSRRVDGIRAAIGERDLERLGPLLEEEAVEMHLVAMSSRPPIFYWSPGTVAVMDAVRSMRDQGIPAYFTMDAGPNVHVLSTAEAEPEVAERLDRLDAVQRVIRDGVGSGPRMETEHLL